MPSFDGGGAIQKGTRVLFCIALISARTPVRPGKVSLSSWVSSAARHETWQYLGAGGATEDKQAGEAGGHASAGRGGFSVEFAGGRGVCESRDPGPRPHRLVCGRPYRVWHTRARGGAVAPGTRLPTRTLPPILSTRILGRRRRCFHLFVFLTASRMVLPKILVLSAQGRACPRARCRPWLARGRSGA